MEKKNPIIGAVLGFFVIGLIYSLGLKKGLIYFVALSLIDWGIAQFSPSLCIIINVVGAYLGYTAVQQYNAVVEIGELPEKTDVQ